ncbi:MAG: DUF1003 domain-containing protein, partial [Deltaproteobacteria bacterium]|nr:DUF1003 domain-containing protein [Deltaproteobacteria bacterium]
MACNPDELLHVPLFELLDEEQTRILAAQVQIQHFAPRQRIFKAGEPAEHGYVKLSGAVRVTTIDEDNQEVVVDEPGHGDFFGFASMIQNTHHHTSAMAMEETVCVEVGRDDIEQLLKRSPAAGMAMLTMQARQFHSAQKLVRARASRNANEMIEEQTTYGERVADAVARFGGSWTFIIVFGVVLVMYSALNVILDRKAWDPYPFILLNLFLSMLASVQAPVIMMSQNRQDAKDRLRSELDFDVNRRSELEIRDLASKLNLLGDKVDDIEDLLRKP